MILGQTLGGLQGILTGQKYLVSLTKRFEVRAGPTDPMRPCDAKDRS